MFLNIYSKGAYPVDKLSNFAPHKFFFDYEIASMEGFLQSLKSPENQSDIYTLAGIDAKNKGAEIVWKDYLYWNGKKYNRYSKEYIGLVEDAYRAMLRDSEEFRQALVDSKGKILIHTVGKLKRSKTVLTSWELCRILMKLRRSL